MKIAFIGAGSTVFGRTLVSDLLAHEALRDSELRLMDIHPERLETAAGMARRLRLDFGVKGFRIRATADRRRAIEGADVVISAMGVGGFDATRVDLTVPARFGVRQTIGDTLGPGGIFRALRGVPELLRLCADMAELCPQAWLLNYSNPMAIHCLAVERATRIRHVGLCHGVQGTARTMRMMVALLDESPQVLWRHFRRPYGSPERIREWAAWWALGDDPALRYTCAGINHMAFFLTFESGGRDLYPALWKAASVPHLRRFDPVRFALMERLGYFMTETSAHTAEYTPWFLKDPREIQRHHLRVGSYLETCRKLERTYQALKRDVQAGRALAPQPYTPSREYAARILNAMATGRPYVFNGNVHNRGGALIANLPGDCCVEVPCVADGNGIRPTAVGALPPACAGLIGTNVAVQDLTVRAILEGDRRYVRQALMLDPNTASSLSLTQIDRLLDALFRAHAHRLPKNLR